MAAAMEQHIQLAQKLPRGLLTFFKKFPPPQLAAASGLTPPAQPTATIHIAENTSSTDPNTGASTTTIPTETPVDPYSNAGGVKRNPFLPFKNLRTGNWHPPTYSLRRQAALFKMARAHHVLSLMPRSPKHPEVKEEKRITHGLRVQGTGAGKKVKGKKWERTMQSRLEERRKALEGMPEMIRLWKQRGHGRGWKKWPK